MTPLHPLEQSWQTSSRLSLLSLAVRGGRYTSEAECKQVVSFEQYLDGISWSLTGPSSTAALRAEPIIELPGRRSQCLDLFNVIRIRLRFMVGHSI